jgi:hypothetical protein
VWGGGWHSLDLADQRRFIEEPEVAQAGHARLLAVRAGRAEGRVLSHDGAPVAGATVWPHFVRRHTDSWVPLDGLVHATSDEEGRYRLDAMIGGLVAAVRATAPGTAPGWSERFRADPGVVARADVVLPPPRFVLLDVVSADDGRRLTAVATWAVHGPLTSQSWHMEARSREDGLLRAGPFVPGRVEFDVRAAGHARARVQLEGDASGAEVRRVALVRALEIAGRVITVSGEPVAGCGVKATRAGGDQVHADTDDEGRFRFEGLVAGPWRVEAFGPGTSDVQTGVEVGTENLVLRVEVEAGPGFVVHVLDPGGGPVPRFEVSFSGEAVEGSDEGTDGRFEAEPGESWDHVLVARARDERGRLLPYAPAALDLTGRRELEVTIRLEPGAALEGRVVGPDGAGVAGVPMEARPQGTSRFEVALDAEAVSGPDGGFRLVGLAQGPHLLRATVSSRFAPFEPIPVVAPASDVVVRLERGVSVTLRVVDPAGAPIVGAEVSVHHRSGGTLCSEVTGAGGDALLAGLDPDGRYALWVHPPAMRGDVAPLRVPAWRPSAGPLGLPAAAPRRGRVLDVRGRPVAGCRVHAGADGIEEFADTDADGRFSIARLPPGRVLLVARANLVPRLVSRVTAHDGLDVDLVVVPARTVRLRLTGREAWPEHGLDLVHPALRPASLRSGLASDGTAHFRVHPEERYGFYAWFRDQDQVAWHEVVPGGPDTVEVPLRPALSIRGRVTPVAPGERIDVAIDERGVHASAVADPGGEFVLRGLPPGRYTVCATRWGGGEAEAVATAGGEVLIDLPR